MFNLNKGKAEKYMKKGCDNMPKPAKSVKLSAKNFTKSERELRENIEESLMSPDSLVYDVPSELTHKKEKDLYKFIVENMKASGVLCNLDVQLLICTVRACLHMNEAEADIKKNGLIIQGKKNAAVDIFNTYQKQFLACCSSLCLSPTSRAKIGSLAIAQIEKENDPYEDIFKEQTE